MRRGDQIKHRRQPRFSKGRRKNLNCILAKYEATLPNFTCKGYSSSHLLSQYKPAGCAPVLYRNVLSCPRGDPMHQRADKACTETSMKHSYRFLSLFLKVQISLKEADVERDNSVWMESDNLFLIKWENPVSSTVFNLIWLKSKIQMSFLKVYGKLLMALGFVRMVCSTSLLELQREESFMHLPSLPPYESFTFTESRWDLYFQWMYLRSKSCNISVQILPCFFRPEEKWDF